MKKNYTVSLDEEVVEYLKPFLEKAGMTLSGYIRQALAEYAIALKNLNLPDDMSKISMSDFLTVFQRMVKGMKK